MIGEITLYDIQGQPIDIGRGRRRYTAHSSSNGECIGFPFQTGRTEIPFGAQARASDGVDDKEVLAEDGGRTNEGKTSNNLSRCEPFPCVLPDNVDYVSSYVEF